MIHEKIINATWWNVEEEGKVHESIFPLVDKIRIDNTARHDAFMIYAMMYGGGFASDYSFGRQARVNSNFTPGPKMKVNIVKSQVDTLRSKITKNKPRPMFLTEGGEWSLRVKSKKLNKFMEGLFNEMSIHDKMSETFLDAAVLGVGALKIYKSKQNITLERVFCGELDVDSADAVDGKPRSMHQTKFIQKEVLVAMFPKHEEDIEKLNDDQMVVHDHSNVRLVKCIESWHLPSGDASGDGRHTICIETSDLVDEAWKDDEFPFAFYKMGSDLRGFYGNGLSEQLQEIQMEINKVLRTIQIALHLSVPKVLVPMNSKIQIEAINNKIGGIIKYSGLKPEYTQLMSVPQELWQHLDWLIKQAFETTGISQLSAQSKKPGGLDSGKALQTFNDIETERFLTLGRDYEKFALDISKRVLGIVAKDKNVTAKYKDGDALEIIKWKDVDIMKDTYLMDVYPVSSLPSEPSAKFQTIQEYIQAGWIDQRAGMKLLDFPDLKIYTDRQTAQEDNIEKIIGKIIEKGEYIVPDPIINLDMLISEAQKAVVYYELRNLPDVKLDLLRLLIDDAQNILLGAQDVEQEQAMEAEEAGRAKADEEAMADLEGAINEQGMEATPPGAETIGQAPQQQVQQ